MPAVIAHIICGGHNLQSIALSLPLANASTPLLPHLPPLLLPSRQVDLKESWYEKLQRWGDACAAYERKAVEDPSNLEWTLGRMRCQHAMGEWGALCTLAREGWASTSLEEERAEVARLAVAGAWNLREWGEMERYCAALPKHSVESRFFRAILSIHCGEHAQASSLSLLPPSPSSHEPTFPVLSPRDLPLFHHHDFLPNTTSPPSPSSQHHGSLRCLPYSLKTSFPP